jgi:hypothetical protein
MYRESFSRQRDLVKYVGFFETNGSSAPTAAQIFIPGVTGIAYSGGVYTLTMEDTYVDLQASISLQLHTAADAIVKLGDMNPTASGGATLTILSVKGSDGVTAVNNAALAGKAGNRIHVTICAVIKGGGFGNIR